MSDLSLAQNHAFDLARTLMVPITPSGGRLAACADARAREASPRAFPADLHIANRALARFHLRGLGGASPNSQES
ncbi:hypothetical protein GOZ89_22740 [Agrobacterium vitis]|uniref:hypothetical protein n=1 Tax=Agrobacterium vitis TaxID=373 RepID=UPI0012E7C1F8|nr:hypothetical protein [Agrobacterium vitis]MVA82233.1 hypothetical protein [Agrobacterium vitis]